VMRVSGDLIIDAFDDIRVTPEPLVEADAIFEASSR
jgi:hypothetical protein